MGGGILRVEQKDSKYFEEYLSNESHKTNDLKFIQIFKQGVFYKTELE